MQQNPSTFPFSYFGCGIRLDRSSMSPSSRPPPAGGLSSAVRATMLAMIAAYLLLSAWIGWRAVMLAPYSDMLDWIAHYYAFNAGWMDWRFFLFAPHNFHRLPWTFGLLLLDIRVFGAQGYLFPVTSALCLGLTAFLLAREGWRAAHGALRMVTAGLAGMLSLMAVNLWSAGLHIHASYIHVLVFSVAAIVVAEPAAGRPVALWRRIATLLLSMAAALGNGAGLVLWPVLIFSALRSRDDLRWTATLVVVGGAFVAAYVGHQAGAAASAAEIGDLSRRVLLFLEFLGLPWSRPAAMGGWVVGALALIACAIAVLLKGGAGSSRAERVAVQLVLYSVGVAALAALGRTGEAAADHVTARYASFLTPMHVGLLILALPWLERLAAGRPRAAAAAVLGAALMLFANQVVAGVLVIRGADANRNAVAAFKAGSRDPALRAVIYPRLERAERVEARLSRDGFFQRELHLRRSAGSDVVP